ncbi:hypothetical protein M23134_06116 [Microscilla marina ATCC 23134]|uniref:Uncharacterized protein n=1 Tax=Microscilla marina ATCC 23134 TaxID=313606 RepID=A1ZSK9_MICM2|nr:hypothetical protein M23134_06116 [Microscilla marina ATCC 23134]
MFYKPILIGSCVVSRKTIKKLLWVHQSSCKKVLAHPVLI